MVLMDEREKYENVWENMAWYRNISPAERDLDMFLDWVPIIPGESVVDLGCGTGRASLQLWKDYEIECVLIDTAKNCLDQDVKKIADMIQPDFLFYEACLTDLPTHIPICNYGLCADVMEHIPPDYVDQALRHIESVIMSGCYFQIALFPHEDYHLTVQNDLWWLQAINKYFDIRMFSTDDRHLRCYATVKDSY